MNISHIELFGWLSMIDHSDINTYSVKLDSHDLQCFHQPS